MKQVLPAKPSREFRVHRKTRISVRLAILLLCMALSMVAKAADECQILFFLMSDSVILKAQGDSDTFYRRGVTASEIQAKQGIVKIDLSMQFGQESFDAILSTYEPSPATISAANWSQMSLVEKKNWLLGRQAPTELQKKMTLVNDTRYPGQITFKDGEAHFSVLDLGNLKELSFNVQRLQLIFGVAKGSIRIKSPDLNRNGLPTNSSQGYLKFAREYDNLIDLVKGQEITDERSLKEEPYALNAMQTGASQVLKIEGFDTSDAWLSKVRRSAYYSVNSREQFSVFAQVESFNHREVLAGLPQVTQNWLTRLPEGRQRLVTYPLRDWNTVLAAMGRNDLRTIVEDTQARYRNRVTEIIESTDSENVDLIMVNIQNAANDFLNQSQILAAIDGWHLGKSHEDPAWSEYWQKELLRTSKFSAAFPNSTWRGDLKDRVQRFIAKYPENIALVPSVSIELGPNAANMNWRASRDVLVISLHNLSYTQMEQLQRDYLDMISIGTISFPLERRADHLFTRIGRRVLDFWRVVYNREYRFPSNEKLEPVIAISPTEELNLRTYAENVVNNFRDVLGNEDYNGSQRTNGQLDNNRCLAGGHNCTSWLATAPIGKNGDTVLDIVGAGRGLEVGTNPGWWSGYLNSKAKADRIPFVVYWNRDFDLATLRERKIVTGQRLEWDFYPH